MPPFFLRAFCQGLALPLLGEDLEKAPIETARGWDSRGVGMSFSNMPASPTFYRGLCVFLLALCSLAQATLVHVWRSEGVGSSLPLCGGRGRIVVGRLGISTDPCQWPKILYFSIVQHSVHNPCNCWALQKGMVYKVCWTMQIYFSSIFVK